MYPQPGGVPVKVKMLRIADAFSVRVQVSTSLEGVDDGLSRLLFGRWCAGIRLPEGRLGGFVMPAWQWCCNQPLVKVSKKSNEDDFLGFVYTVRSTR